MPSQRCVYRDKKGVQCKLKSQATSYLCHNHDPAKKDARKKTGKRSRRKGSTFERDVANDLKPMFPNARRAGLRQTQSGSDDAPDVDGCAPFWIETKHGKLTNPRAALKQAEDAAANHAKLQGITQYQWPIAVCKDDRQPAFVVIRWKHFKELLEQWQNE